VSKAGTGSCFIWAFKMNDDQGIMYKLGAIEAYLKSIGEKLDKAIEDQESRHKDHEQRLASVEKAQVKIYAVASVLAAIVTGVLNWLK
jgi:hypothetical protein